MSGRRIFRYEVPVDDRDHRVHLPEYVRIVKIGARRTDAVEFWGLVTGSDLSYDRVFRVLGTGQPIPNGYEYIGTPEPVAGGQLVWHLFERRIP